MRKNILLSIGFFIITAFCFAQDNHVFTLREAQEYAFNNNEEVKNSLLDVEAARKRIWESTALGLPQVNIDAEFNYFIDIPTSVVDATFFNPNAQPGDLVDFRMGTDFNSKAGVTVSQLIFDGSYFVGLKAAKNFKILVDKQLEQTKTNVYYRISNAYMGVLIAEENSNLIDELLESTQKLYDHTKEIYNSGLIGEIELDQIELTLNNINNAKKRAERNVLLSKNLLKFQMGIPLNDSIELSENLDNFMIDVKEDLAIQPEGFIRNHIDYLVLQEQRELNELNRQLARSKNYPSLGAFFTHSQQAFGNQFDFLTNGTWFPTTLVGIQLKIPITSSGMRRAQEAQKKIVVEQMDNNLILLERSIQLNYEQSKTRYLNAYEMYENEQKNLEVSSKIYNNAIERKEVGFAGALQVTQAQTQHINSQQSYISALYELLESKTELDKLLNNLRDEK